MAQFTLLVVVYSLLIGSCWSNTILGASEDDCVITKYSQVDSVSSKCTNITIRSLTMPAGKRLDLTLLPGTNLTFEGRTTFEYFQWPEWGASLIQIVGSNLTVQGAPGHELDGQGGLYWDSLGDKGTVKPFFMGIRVNNSIFKNINMLNCPHHCTLVGDSNGITITDWNIDCSYGNDRGGHNTDGFDVFGSTNVVIKDSLVVNHDDCVAVNQGSNMHFSNLHCSGSHGFSISVGFSQTSVFNNTLRNLTYSDCTVVNAENGIHIKTHNDGGNGSISDIVYENIKFSGIKNYGINIQQDYADGGSTGIAKSNIPISNVTFRNIKGFVSTETAMPVYIFCGEDGCSNFTWSNIDVIGGNRSSWCNFTPDGYPCSTTGGVSRNFVKVEFILCSVLFLLTYVLL